MRSKIFTAACTITFCIITIMFYNLHSFKNIEIMGFNENIIILFSYLQLDESCLNALPEEMQREIKEAYQHQQQQQQHRQCLSTVLKSPQKSPKGKSPRKQSPQNKGRSPGRSPGKHSPQFKVPRGRPGRGRPKKLEFRQKGQPTIFSAVTGKQVLLHVIMHCCSLFIQFLKNRIFFLGL